MTAVTVALTVWAAKGRTFRGLQGTAPCGCTFNGRLYSTRDCTVMAVDDPEQTGARRTRHAMTVEKNLIRGLTVPTT